MALKDNITIDTAGWSAGKIEKLKKAFAPRVGLTDEQTWEDVTVAMAIEKIASIIKTWVKNIDESETSVSYTDMDA